MVFCSSATTLSSIGAIWIFARLSQLSGTAGGMFISLPQVSAEALTLVSDHRRAAVNRRRKSSSSGRLSRIALVEATSKLNPDAKPSAVSRRRRREFLPLDLVRHILEYAGRFHHGLRIALLIADPQGGLGRCRSDSAQQKARNEKTTHHSAATSRARLRSAINCRVRGINSR